MFSKTAIVVSNLIFNIVLAFIFVRLNIWALDMGLEETFVTLALMYGVLMVASNSIFILLTKSQ